jgi:hypothetical protein
MKKAVRAQNNLLRFGLLSVVLALSLSVCGSPGNECRQPARQEESSMSTGRVNPARTAEGDSEKRRVSAQTELATFAMG